MQASGISGSSFAAIGGGVRGELKANLLREAFDDAGVLDANLAEGFRAVESLAHQVTKAGLAQARHDLVGELIDVLG